MEPQDVLLRCLFFRLEPAYLNLVGLVLNIVGVLLLFKSVLSKVDDALLGKAKPQALGSDLSSVKAALDMKKEILLGCGLLFTGFLCQLISFLSWYELLWVGYFYIPIIIILFLYVLIKNHTGKMAVLFWSNRLWEGFSKFSKDAKSGGEVTLDDKISYLLKYIGNCENAGLLSDLNRFIIGKNKPVKNNAKVKKKLVRAIKFYFPRVTIKP